MARHATGFSSHEETVLCDGIDGMGWETSAHTIGELGGIDIDARELELGSEMCLT